MTVRRRLSGSSGPKFFGYDGDYGLDPFGDFGICMEVQFTFKLKDCTFKGHQPLFGDGCGVAAPSATRKALGICDNRGCHTRRPTGHLF